MLEGAGETPYIPPYEGRALAPLCSGWMAKFELARKWKKEQFQEDADEAMDYFDGMGKKFWDLSYACGPRGYLADGWKGRMPSFTLTMNIVSRFVQLFGPSMYQQNPHRTVFVRERSPLPPEVVVGMAQQQVQQMLAQQPMMLMPEQMQMIVDQQANAILMQEQQEVAIKQTAASIMEEYLNYTPDELDLVSNIRRAIDEGIIKGAGCLWTEVYTPPGSTMRMIGSFYDSIDNLYVDPDAEQWEDVKVVYRKCVHPYRDVEREYGLKEGSLKRYATHESAHSQGESSTDDQAKDSRNRGATNDLLTYYKVYSKCGIGIALSGFGINKDGTDAESASLRPLLEQLDDRCYLVVVPGCEYPLNLPPELQQMQFEDQMLPDGSMQSGADQMLASIQEAVRWPIPLWLDGGWPVEVLSFHEKPNQVWPISHLKPGIGHLQFLNWALSFMAERVMVSSTTPVGVMDSVMEEVTKALQNPSKIPGFALLPIKTSMQAKINDMIQPIDTPTVNLDLWTLIEMVNADFEKQTGLNELAYGNAETQSRSAADIQIRQSNSSVRIDDMRRRVEKFSERIARKEAIAVRWLLGPEDLSPVVGEMRAQLADQLLFNQPMDQVAREFSYQIGPGDGATRNRLMQQQNVMSAIQTFMPVFSQLIGAGQPGAFNAMLEQFGKSFDFDVSGMMVQPPMMPPMPPEGEQQGPPPAEAA
jgi:hypothetical protein